MSERILLTGGPDEAAAQLWAHIQEKTMLNGEKLCKFDSPVEAATYYTPHLSREMLENQNIELVRTLQKMRAEREDIFEKNSALEDACGKLMKEKAYLQEMLVKSITTFSEAEKRYEQRLTDRIREFELIEQQYQAKASARKDQEHPQSKEQTLDAYLQ